MSERMERPSYWRGHWPSKRVDRALRPLWDLLDAALEFASFCGHAPDWYVQPYARQAGSYGRSTHDDLVQVSEDDRDVV